MDNERKEREVEKTLKKLSRVEKVAKLLSVAGMFASLILVGYFFASSSMTSLYCLVALLVLSVVSVLVWHNVEQVWTLLESMKYEVRYLEGRIKRTEGENVFIPTDPESKVTGYDA